MFDMDLYREANKKIREGFLLSNCVTLRVRQLQSGSDSLVECEGMSDIDIALLEIAQGKIEAREEEITTGEDLFGSPVESEDEEEEKEEEKE